MRGFAILLLVVWAVTSICSLPTYDTSRIAFDVFMFSSAFFVLKNMHLLINSLPIIPLPFDNLPDDGYPEEYGGVVYLMRDSQGLHKIGFTHDLKRRYREIQHERSGGVEIVHYIVTNHASAVEFRLHQQFAHKRVLHEWFALTPEDVALIRKVKSI